MIVSFLVDITAQPYPLYCTVYGVYSGASGVNTQAPRHPPRALTQRPARSLSTRLGCRIGTSALVPGLAARRRDCRTCRTCFLSSPSPSLALARPQSVDNPTPSDPSSPLIKLNPDMLNAQKCPCGPRLNSNGQLRRQSPISAVGCTLSSSGRH